MVHRISYIVYTHDAVYRIDDSGEGLLYITHIHPAQPYQKTNRTPAPAAEALQRGACPHLRALSLQSTGLDDTAAARLAGVLGSWHAPQLALLDLRLNQLSCRGMAELAAAFATGACRSIRVLQLDSNQIGPQGIATLAAAFVAGAFPLLTELHLR